MGICISYKGRLTDPARLDEALAAIREFCGRAKWACHEFKEHYSGVALVTQAEADGDPVRKKKQMVDEPWPEETGPKTGLRMRVSTLNPPDLLEDTARGVIVETGDTEGLRLVFNESGRLVQYMEVPAEMVINAMPETAHYMAFKNFVKTSGAPQSHAAICLLLKLLKQSFMKNLKVNDPTGYWKNGDVQQLQLEHGVMGAMLGVVRPSLETGGLLRGLMLGDAQYGRIEFLDDGLAAPVAKTPRKRKVN